MFLPTACTCSSTHQHIPFHTLIQTQSHILHTHSHPAYTLTPSHTCHTNTHPETHTQRIKHSLSQPTEARVHARSTAPVPESETCSSTVTFPRGRLSSQPTVEARDLPSLLKGELSKSAPAAAQQAHTLDRHTAAAMWIAREFSNLSRDF